MQLICPRCGGRLLQEDEQNTVYVCIACARPYGEKPQPEVAEQLIKWRWQARTKRII